MDSCCVPGKLAERRHQSIVSGGLLGDGTAGQCLGTGGGERTEKDVAGHFRQVDQLQDSVEERRFMRGQHTQDHSLRQVQVDRIEAKEVLQNVQPSGEGGNSSGYVRHGPGLVDHGAVLVLAPDGAQKAQQPLAELIPLRHVGLGRHAPLPAHRRLARQQADVVLRHEGVAARHARELVEAAQRVLPQGRERDVAGSPGVVVQDRRLVLGRRGVEGVANLRGVGNAPADGILPTAIGRLILTCQPGQLRREAGQHLRRAYFVSVA